MDDSAPFGRWLRERRAARDISREALARQINCAVVTIKKIETGERRPSRQIAELILDALAVPTEERTAIVRLARSARPASPAPQTPPLTPADLGIEDLSGRTIRGYALHERLGAGGFGVVYRAEQPGIGRAVAIKIILPQYANLPEFIRRFEAEAQIIARLEHPHIVPLYDFWREPGGAYLVMRYVPGGTLHSMLQRGPLAVDVVARLLGQVGAALAVAHRAGVVHRDLKPSNILLDNDGNAYLADFGIAKDLGNADLADRTQPGAILGSPAYLSPEQIKDEPITPRSDIYSLGILLYELLTGAKPFQAPTPGELIQKQLAEPTPALRERCSDLPTALEEVIRRAMAKNPADRYPDVLSLVADLRRATADHRPPTTDNGRKLAVGGQPSVVGENATAVVELPDLANPYKGLRAFGEADAANFFGRDALVARLLERLAEAGDGGWGLGVRDDMQANSPSPIPYPPSPIPRFLAVVGPSGSGKSSVVKAGLIPALRRGGLPGSECWFIAEMLPGAHPLEELELALLRLAAERPANLAEQLARDERGLLRAARLVLPAEDESELLLVIDQFEEVFTLVEDEAARAHFLASIVAAVTDERSRVRVVITLRADFYDRPLLYPELGELVRARTEVVLPLTLDELEQAVVSPAARAGLILEPRLAAEIVKDVGEQPGALPLLQYALTELFEHREGRTLTQAAYRASGGVRGALARRAESIYAWLDEPAQAAARQLFLRLITLGEGVEDTRRRTPRAELTALTTDQTKNQEPRTKNQLDGNGSRFSVLGSGPVMDDVIDRYGHARLLSFDRDPITREPTVEVAHEALLREWGRLRSWLDAGRADIRMQRLLAATAAEWSAAGREPSYLLSGARLAQFEGWAAQTGLALTQDERAFLETSLAERKCQEAAERERQQRELETARQLAQEQERRAEEQRHAATRLRRRAVFLAGVSILALLAASAAGIFANNSATLATQNAAVAATAQAEAQLRATQQAIAEANFVQAERLRLAGEANTALDRGDSGELPALLAIRSLRYGYSPQADSALLQSLAHGFSEQRIISHTSEVEVGAVAFSPDGKYLLTAADRTVQLWDAQSGQQRGVFSGHFSWIRDVAFSPDGNYVLTGAQDGTWRLWERATGRQLRGFELIGDSDNPNYWVESVAFSPDGHYILTGSEDKKARLWDVSTGQHVRTFAGHTNAVSGVAFAPDGKHILTGSEDNTARLWDSQTGQQLRVYSGHTDRVGSVAFSPDGKHILTGSNDTTARLWDTQTGQQLRVFRGHKGWIPSVAFSPDGKQVLTGSADMTGRLWDVATGRQLGVLSGHTAGVYDVAFSPDGKEVLTGSADKTARLWDIQAETEPRTVNSQANPVSSAALSPDGKAVLTGNDLGIAELWDTQTGERLRVFAGHEGPVISVGFAPGGKQVVTSSGNEVSLWDIQTGEQLRVFNHVRAVTAIAFSPDGKLLVTGSAGNFARLWDVATGQSLHRFGDYSAAVSSVAFSPSGKQLIIGTAAGLVLLYDAVTTQPLRQFGGYSAAITGVAFAPNGKYALISSTDTTTRLWDVAAGQEVRRLTGHTDAVTAMAFAPDGKYVLTGSADHTARLWDVATGQEVRRFAGHTDAVTYVAFSPDGKHVLTGSLDTTARLWRIDIQDVIRLACARLLRDFTPEERTLYGIPDDGPTCPKP